MTSPSKLSRPSVLVIGATGKTGLATIKQLAQDSSKPTIYAMARDPSKLADHKDVVALVYQGDARKADDIENALYESKADWVIVSVGNGDDVSPTDIRAANAQATVSVLKKPAYSHVRAIVVSSTGAGTSKIIVGMGTGKLISYYLRHVLADHTEQERLFTTLGSRATIPRATSLTDNKPTGKLVAFADTAKSPTIKTDREDLAKWITNEICGTPVLPNGGCINLTGAKKL